MGKLTLEQATPIIEQLAKRTSGTKSVYGLDYDALDVAVDIMKSAVKIHARWAKVAYKYCNCEASENTMYYCPESEDKKYKKGMENECKYASTSYEERCSNCGIMNSSSYKNYCPNCGAIMDLEEEVKENGKGKE